EARGSVRVDGQEALLCAVAKLCALRPLWGRAYQGGEEHELVEPPAGIEPETPSLPWISPPPPCPPAVPQVAWHRNCRSYGVSSRLRAAGGSRRRSWTVPTAMREAPCTTERCPRPGRNPCTTCSTPSSSAPNASTATDAPASASANPTPRPA